MLKISLAFAFILSSTIAFGVDPMEDPMSSQGLLQEAISEVKNPHVFDWRKSSYELDLAYVYVDEKNNFENDGGALGLGIPVGGGFVFRSAIRRINVYGSESSRQIGRTPFRQASGVTRYEYMMGGALSLMEGRVITRFSPMIPDLESVLHVTAGLHYSHPSRTMMPRRNDPPDTMPGQRPVNSKGVVEVGLRWQIYFPKAFGMFYEVSRNFPIEYDRNLSSWNVFSGGITWADTK